MKIQYAAALFLVALGPALQAQDVHSLPIVDQRTHDGSLLPAPPGAVVKVEIPHSECLNDESRRELNEEIAANIARIRLSNPAAMDDDRGSQPFFSWPTRPSAGFTGYGYYTNNNFVDHNPLPNNNLTDWNCGTRTYDWSSGNHMGTDIILWPYAWRRMQEGVMEVVAAAPGTIVTRRDGYYDTQCSNSGQTTWNGIVLQHADGSTTIYMHFKNGSVTSKIVGETVEEGEYLGLAGSSGSSNWPHLHFEVHDNTGGYIDPFAGPCNSFNGNQTWWAAQQPYKVPRINHISTHYDSREFYQCPVPEITYEQSNFMPGDSLILRCYYRDLDNNALTSLRIRKTGGPLVASWDFNSPWAFGATTWAWWYFIVDNTWTTGHYSFEATFNGQEYVRPFTVGMPVGVDDNEASGTFGLAPNPAGDRIRITGLPAALGRANALLYDGTGRLALNEPVSAPSDELDVSLLPPGIYHLRIDAIGQSQAQRLIIAR